MFKAMDNKNKPNIIVSRCLTGKKCRYDKTSCPSKVVDSLASRVNFIDICPEMDIGLGVPRETLSLFDTKDQGIKMLTNINRFDVTDKMKDYFDTFFKNNIKIDGAILKSKSPSCGYLDVKLFSLDGQILEEKNSGLFTQELLNKLDDIVVESDKRLNDKNTKRIFYNRIFKIIPCFD